jgi:hypothetical protein
MSTPSHRAASDARGKKLHFIDGSASHGSYAALARRGTIFLGVKFGGLVDGAQFGVPGKSYLHVRIRSARNQTLAERLDHKHGVENVVNLFELHLVLDEAWPGFTFEKVDQERASLLVGMFVDGSLTNETHAVVARIKEADLLLKLVDYAIGRVGAEYRIAPAEMVADWLSGQAKPAMDQLTQVADHQKLALKAQKEFEKLIGGQLETAGPHLQQLKAIYQKHMRAHAHGA